MRASLHFGKKKKSRSFNRWCCQEVKKQLGKEGDEEVSPFLGKEEDEETAPPPRSQCPITHDGVWEEVSVTCDDTSF